MTRESVINSAGTNSESMTFGSRVAGTIIVGVGWLAFLVLWLAFYVGRFGFWQNLAIFIVSAIVAIGIVAVIWIKWVLG